MSPGRKNLRQPPLHCPLLPLNRSQRRLLQPRRTCHSTRMAQTVTAANSHHGGMPRTFTLQPAAPTRTLMGWTKTATGQHANPFREFPGAVWRIPQPPAVRLMTLRTITVATLNPGGRRRISISRRAGHLKTGTAWTGTRTELPVKDSGMRREIATDGHPIVYAGAASGGGLARLCRLAGVC